MTIIKDDVVEKLPTNAKAQKHIENMGKIIKNIKNENIEILDYEENSKIYSKLVKNEKTLDRMLARKYNNIEELIQILNEYKNDCQWNLERVSYDSHFFIHRFSLNDRVLL